MKWMNVLDDHIVIDVFGGLLKGWG